MKKEIRSVVQSRLGPRSLDNGRGATLRPCCSALKPRSWGCTITQAAPRGLARAVGIWGGDEMNLQLNGKKALVTGSTAGIGFAIAALLAREGAHVVVNGRSAERVAGTQVTQ